jgi:hypothetical protein
MVLWHEFGFLLVSVFPYLPVFLIPDHHATSLPRYLIDLLPCCPVASYD